MDAKLKLVGRYNSWPSLYRNYRGGLVSASSGDYPSELMKGAVKVLYGGYFRVYAVSGGYVLQRHDGGTDHLNSNYYFSQKWEDVVWGARQVCRAQDRGFKLFPKYGEPYHEKALDKSLLELEEKGCRLSCLAENLIEKKIGFGNFKREVKELLA